MAKSKLVEVLRLDRWTGVEGHTDIGPFLLRYRTPVLASPDTTGYGHLLTIVWPFAAEGTGEMPTRDDSKQMKEFEDRFCEAVEHDAAAIAKRRALPDRADDRTRSGMEILPKSAQACARRLLTSHPLAASCRIGYNSRD